MNEEEQQQSNQLQEPQTQSASTQAHEPTPEKDHEGKPLVKICGSCEYAGEEGYGKLTLNADEKILNELRAVHKQVQANSKKYSFTHGVCAPHYMRQIMDMPNVSVDKIKAAKKITTNNPNVPPCLIQDDALRHAYMRGLFTKQEIEQAAQQVQQSNQNLTERFKRLAGIIK